MKPTAHEETCKKGAIHITIESREQPQEKGKHENVKDEL